MERGGDTETVAYTREGVLGLLDADPEALLVAESDGGEIVGSLIAAWDGWRGSFYRLAVNPEQRRQGIGTALLREGERRLLAHGAARLTAIVADDDVSTEPHLPGHVEVEGEKAALKRGTARRTSL